MKKYQRNTLWLAVTLALSYTSVFASCTYTETDTTTTPPTINNGTNCDTPPVLGIETLTLNGTTNTILTDIRVDGNLPGDNATLMIGNGYRSVQTDNNATAAYAYAQGNAIASISIKSDLILTKNNAIGLLAEAVDTDGQAIITLGQKNTGTPIPITIKNNPGVADALIGVYAMGGKSAEIISLDDSLNPLKYDINLTASGSIGLFARTMEPYDSLNLLSEAKIDNITGNISIGNGFNSTTASAAIKVQTKGNGYIGYDDADGVIKLTSGLDYSTPDPGKSAAILGILDQYTEGNLTINVANIKEIHVDVLNSSAGISAFAETDVPGNMEINFLNGIINANGDNVDGISANHNGIGETKITTAGIVKGGSDGALLGRGGSRIRIFSFDGNQ